MNMKDLNLRPCPYCGSDTCLMDFEHPDNNTLFYVSCEQCHASGPEAVCDVKAAELWNSVPQKLECLDWEANWLARTAANAGSWMGAKLGPSLMRDLAHRAMEEHLTRKTDVPA